MAVTVLDAPSNLGLRPPMEGSVPGCYKAPWALREAGLLRGVAATNAGVQVPPRYESTWAPGTGDRNAAGLVSYTVGLADRLEPMIGNSFIVVLGGDCSILLGEALALRRRGRYGLAFVDGHGDFRHQGNGELIAAAGEDLAIVTGRGDPRLTDLDSRGPSVRDEDVEVIGVRADDTFLCELRGLGMPVWSADRVADLGAEAVVADAAAYLTRPELDGYWIHLDVDVLDAAVMPAVDSPEPGGLSVAQLGRLLSGLAANPNAVGMDVCIFDPDLDQDGRYARLLATMLNQVIVPV